MALASGKNCSETVQELFKGMQSIMEDNFEMHHFGDIHSEMMQEQIINNMKAIKIMINRINSTSKIGFTIKNTIGQLQIST